MDTFKTNRSGFIEFQNRNKGFKGDRDTWARISGNQLTIFRAKRGLMSGNYYNEMCLFCSEYGIDFDSIDCGEKRTIEI